MDKLLTQSFEGKEVDFFRKNDNILLSMEQLQVSLGFAGSRNLELILERNPELRSDEFSMLIEVDNLEDGVYKKRKKRFFNEDGVYEVAFKARTEKAIRFRRFVREILKRVKKKEIVVQPVVKEIFSNTFILESKEILKKLDNANDEVIIPMLDKLMEAYNSCNNKIEALEKRIISLTGSFATMNETLNVIVREFNEIDIETE